MGRPTNRALDQSQTNQNHWTQSCRPLKVGDKFFVVNMIDLRGFGYSGGTRVFTNFRGLMSDI
jgi:hypothetical protein